MSKKTHHKDEDNIEEAKPIAEEQAKDAAHDASLPVVEEPAAEEAKEEAKEEPKKDDTVQFYAALERLRKEVEEKDRKLIEYIQAHKKHVQESDRVKQRLRDDMDKKLKSANADLLKRVLPMFDDLERAMAHAKKSNDVDGLINGIRMVVTKFNAEFENAGLEKFNNKGQKFNPNLEEAISIIPVMSKEQDDIIIEVLEDGYRMGDNLIRPAKVVVGKFSG